MVSITELVHNAEDQWGSIGEAPYNCPQFVAVRIILKYDTVVKNRNKNKILKQIKDGYSTSEIARKYGLTYQTVYDLAKREGLHMHSIYRWASATAGRMYYSANKEGLRKHLPGVKIYQVFNRYKDLQQGDMYYENGKWRMKK